MGPTNVALVKLFQADQQLRAARERLDAAAKNVRVQERRVNDLVAKLKTAQTQHKEAQAKSGSVDLDLKSRDAHIEKLRTQQQTAKNNKEYQAFLIEINTAKVDKGKIEEEAMRVMEQVDKTGVEVASLTTQLEAERKRHTEMSAQIGDTLKQLQTEVDAVMPARNQAASGLPAKVIAEFDRLADRFDGEALSAIAKPDRRREEYLCTACNMDLVTDIYNKLHSRDDLVFCPSCRRLLFIPEDLPPEAAINLKSVKSDMAPRKSATPRGTRSKKVTTIAESVADEEGTPLVVEQRAKGKLGEVLSKAQGESVGRAAKAEQKPFEFEIYVDGELAGIYKGISADNLERAVKYFMDESNLTGVVRIAPVIAASAAADVAALQPGDPLPQAPNLIEGETNAGSTQASEAQEQPSAASGSEVPPQV